MGAAGRSPGPAASWLFITPDLATILFSPMDYSKEVLKVNE